MGLMSAAINVTAEIADNYSKLTPQEIFHIIKFPLIDELTGVYTFWLLIPVILTFFKRYPLGKNNFLKRFPIYLLFTIAVGLTHTLMMYISRLLIYPLLGFGIYDYGYIPFRIIMEYLKQFIIFWVTYSIYMVIKMNKEKEEQKIRTAKLEELLTKTRLEALKMQLNPHFLFNTLNMISSTMYDNLETADRMIANLSDLLRITLKSSGKGENVLINEIEILNLYIEIMKSRFKEKLEVEINIDKELDNALVPNFLFQPIVENSIKYGMENLSITKIYIAAKRENDKLLLHVKDNGPGINENERNILKKGVGLSNTVERLEKLYGSDYDFSWENLPEGGLLINISIPFKEEKN
jgi:LytS/YehU family sensor histidine kinase